MSELKKLLKEGKDWLNAFDVCLNGEDAQMVKLAKETLTLKKKIEDLEAKLEEAVKILKGVREYEFCVNKIEDFIDEIEEKEVQGE